MARWPLSQAIVTASQVVLVIVPLVSVAAVLVSILKGANWGVPLTFFELRCQSICVRMKTTSRRLV